ncbi:DUF4136 domain-containing protein [Bizionia saleffrena]|uniref:DUF4136 domain-containing protein n=1 Tax=Bizionia saleffrena TaxID=291189 RepID=A0A8H2LEE3_9FLAO|nr:DUF4136 domain-containing protein [Bizionia saleffrena]TYB73895.1 DUF4136 domain-containing protein [Bizionia saleffrena]
MKFIKLLLLCVFLCSCSAIQVTSDYEKTATFSEYKTYNYFSNIESGLNELDDKRLIIAITKSLSKQGLSVSETPDFLIDFKMSQHQEAPRNNVGVGLGGGNGGIGGGISIGIPMGQNKVNQSLLIEFVDDSKMGLFWQGKGESSMNPKASPEQRESYFRAVVDKIFTQYPPKPKQ